MADRRIDTDGALGASRYPSERTMTSQTWRESPEVLDKLAVALAAMRHHHSAPGPQSS